MLSYGLSAQEPAALETRLLGRAASVLLDMPGDDSGVDLQVRQQPAVNEEFVKERLVKYGIALRRGQRAEVTAVKRKGGHIEVQLNGGGFTNRQLLALPGYDSAHWGMSEEEHKFRYRISGTRDKDRRRRLESDYDRLRKRRVQPLREKLEREQRAQHGSRFNVRFTSDREAAQVTAEELREILRPYLEIQ